MAFNGLAQELPPPQFVQEGSTPSFPDRSSFQSCQEALLRRENVADYSGLQQSRPSYIAKDYIAKDQGNDTKTINNNKVCEKIGGPTWLSNAVIRQQSAASFLDVESNRKWCGCEAGAHCVHSSFLHLKTQRPANPATCKSSPSNALGRSQWPSPPTAIVDKADQHAATLRGELLGEEECTVGSTELNHSPVQRRDLHSNTANSSELVDATETTEYEKRQENWQTSRLKADILLHPLYEQFLAAHVGCLRIATPVDHIPKIDEQLGQAQCVTSKHLALGNHRVPIGEEKDELDQFMTHYLLLLCSFKEQLQQHVRVHAMEAVMACWEIEQNLIALTGVTPGTEGTGATMSDDDNDDQEDSDPLQYDLTLDGHDNGGFGPLIPTETERSLMERVRQELKAELKQGYKDRIVDVREEILRKRRAGKLPGDTTSVLKSWWHAHSKWPYPTEDEKARLVQETGLQLKQINNWFINQRKRNWHTNPSSSSSKTKRKRGLNDAPSR